MELLGLGILTWITFLPIIGMVAVLIVPKENQGAVKWLPLVITGVQVVLAVMIFFNFNRSLAGINTLEGMQFVEKGTWIDIKGVPWFGRIVVEYFMGGDGLSGSLVLLPPLIS